MRGQEVFAPSGERVVLVDIGLVELLDNDAVRVWDVSLEPGGVHPWHLHHNPYVVLSVEGSEGRMDWLDGSPPRFISEYRGGAVYRPVSPVHRLTNIGDRFYRNRLVELKGLGEHLPTPLDIGPGARSIAGESIGARLPDGREPVIAHPHVSVWSVAVEPGDRRQLQLADTPHVVASLEVPPSEVDRSGGVRFHLGGRLTLANDSPQSQSWFVVELTYLDNLTAILAEGSA